MSSESPHAEPAASAAPTTPPPATAPDVVPGRPDGQRPRRRWLLGVAGVLALVAGLWALAWFAAGAGVAPGTRVLDVEIGGMSRGEAVRTLEEELGPRAAAAVPVSVAGRTVQLEPAAAGVTFDADATVGRSGGRDWRPNRLLAALFGTRDLEPVVTVDEARLGTALSSLVAGVEKPPREGDVVFEGAKAVAVPPVPGTRIDRAAAGEAIRASFLRSSASVSLSTQIVPARVDAAEVQRAMEEFGEPAMAGPVTVRAAGREVVVEPERLAPAVSMTADGDGRLQPAVDGLALAGSLEEEDPAFLQSARDASLRVVKGRPKIVKAKQGRELDPENLAAEVLRVLPLSGARTVDVAMQVTEPKVPTSEIEALGVKEKVSEFTQPFPYAYYRVTNIGRAAKYINGKVLKPGEVFSMNDTVKERTEANGYVVGTVISGGRFREELGGGVSTITTAMWTAAFYAGLERIEQRGHSFYVSRYKPGLEATVAWGALDLKFRNNTPHAVLITTDVGNDYVTVRMWSTKVYDRVVADYGPRRNVVQHATVYDAKPGCVEQPGEDGFDITVTRLYYKDGDRVKSDSYATHYNPQARILCRPEPRAAGPASSGSD